MSEEETVQTDLDSVENLLDTVKAEMPLSSEDLRTLEHMADAVAFGDALTALFTENGLIEQTDETSTNFSLLENVVDGIFMELFAAVFYLSSVGEEGEVSKSLMEVSAQLSSQEAVPPQVTRGYQMLAARVEATREQRKKLYEDLDKPSE